MRRLVEIGYAITFDSNYLVIRDIPYLNSEKQLQIGAIVTKLLFETEEKVKQENHQIFFAGSSPHNIDGTPIPNLGDSPTQLALSEASLDIVVQRSFSNKPKTETGLRDFQDFFEKIESYVSIISGPAIELHNVTPYTHRASIEIPEDTVFKIHDTMTSRAEITDLSRKFKDDVIAIIGLGGTGAYVLDFLVKTPVKEIRAFDNDHFYVHNAFRSPGKHESSEFGKSKADIYHSRHDNFRHGLTIKHKLIDASSGEELNGVTFAFVCVDKGSSRAQVFDLLTSKKIPFIDVGMGLSRMKGVLNGLIRTTYYPSDKAQILLEKKLSPLTDSPDEEYKTNIQIGELNALNACLAVIKFKQLRGFYFEDEPMYHQLFDIGDGKIVGKTNIDED